MNALSPSRYKRTKIVCTIGPASSNPDIIKQLIDAGMDVARLNFSHGSHDDHAAVIRAVREASKSAGRPIALLQDLQGPKIRLDTLPEKTTLKDGTILTLGPAGSEALLPIQFNFIPYIKTGDMIYIDDGNVELQVVQHHGDTVSVSVIAGGIVSSHKGINIPDTAVPNASLTSKDREDVLFGVSQHVDYVALSFVQTAQDVSDLRAILTAQSSDAKIIAKIERREAVSNIDDIMKAADGVMVARGDLALEAGLEEVPIIQRKLIDLGHHYRKPVIVATQMLESMITHHAPTRAEVNDVATAVMAGSDAVMLSAETAAGEHPVITVKTMTRIIRRTEKYVSSLPRVMPSLDHVSSKSRSTDAVAAAAAVLAEKLEADLLVIGTASGYSANVLSATRTPVPMVAVTHEVDVYHRMALLWGIDAVLVPKVDTIDDFFSQALAHIVQRDLVQSGATVVIASGSHPGEVGGTNVVKIHTL